MGGRHDESTLFDRLNQELEAFGKKAQSALDEGKLQIELLRVRRKQDHGARDLGLLIYRRERGGEAEPRRIDALLLRLDDLGRVIGRLGADSVRARPKAPAPPSAAGPARSAPSGPAALVPGRHGHPDAVGVVAAEAVHAQPHQSLQVADLVHGPGDDGAAGVMHPATSSWSTCCHSCHSVLAPTACMADSGILQSGGEQDAAAERRARFAQAADDAVVEAVHRVARRAPGPPSSTASSASSCCRAGS